MATPPLIKPLSDDALQPMTPVGFQQDPTDRPLGSRARLRGRDVVWAGNDYGWQSTGSFEKLRREDRLPRPDTGQPLGERGRAEAAAERNAGPLKPLVQLMNWGKSPDIAGPRLVGGPINALSRLGNAIGDVVQGKKVDTSDAWVLSDEWLDDPKNNPVRAKYRVMDRVLGMPEKAARQRSLEVTPADVAARPAAGEIGAQIGAAALTMGLGTVATGASALLAKAPALARLSKVVSLVPKATAALTPTSAATKSGALARLGVATAAEQVPAALMTDYQQGGSLANAVNDLSVQLGGARFMPGEIDPRRDDYISAWRKGASWDVVSALSLVGGLSLFPAVRRASYGDLTKLPEDIAAATAAPEIAPGGAAPGAGAIPAAEPVAPTPGPKTPGPAGAAAVAEPAPSGPGLIGERVATARYQQEQAAITKRAEARAALVADGHLEDIGDGAFDFPRPPEMVVEGAATTASPLDVGAGAADAAGAAAPPAPGGRSLAAGQGEALPNLSDLDLLPEGVADIRPEADTAFLKLQELGDQQLQATWDRQMTPEDAGIDVAAKQQELEQQRLAVQQEEQQVAAELERNRLQQALIPPRVQPDGPLVPAGTVLFHGTGADVAQQIAASGFKVSKNSDSVFGEGVYFTPNDRYASGYGISADGSDGLLLQGQLPEGVSVLDIPASGLSTNDWLKANGLGKKSEVKAWAQERGYDGVLFDPDFKAKPKAGGDPTAAHDLLVFDTNVADNIVGNANAKPIGSYTPSYEDLAGGDTRGKGQFFHGAASSDIQLEEGYYSGRNIYGEGFYSTDDIRTAASYQKKNKKTAGASAAPAVYQVTEKQPVKFFDLDQPIEPGVKQLLEQIAENSESFSNALGDLEGGYISSMAQFMDAVRDSSRDAGESADTITEWFEALKSDLREQGFGGFTHQGGKLGGRGNRLHQVNIYWDPQTQLDIQKLQAPEPIGPVDLTALERQLQDVTARKEQLDIEASRLQVLQQPPEMPVLDQAEFAGRDLAAVADQLDGGELPRLLDDDTRKQYTRDLMRVAIQRGELQPPSTPLPSRLELPKDEILAELFLRDHFLARDARAAQAQVDAWKQTVAYDDLDFEGKKKAGLMQRGFDESAAEPVTAFDPSADGQAVAQGGAPAAKSVEIPAAAARPLKPNREQSAAESLSNWVNTGIPGEQQAVGSMDDALALVRAKGQVLDPDAIPGLDMATARDDKAMGRTTAATEAVAQAYREFYGIEAPRTRMEPFDPTQEYLRADADGNLWTSKGPVIPSEGELKALRDRVTAETAARAAQSEANTARLAELQARMDQLRNDALKGGC